MGTVRIDIANVMQHDWAQNERRAAIAAASRSVGRRIKSRPTAVWMVDVSGVDRRSVKFQLRRGWSPRCIWWNVFSVFHQLLSPSGSLESAMYRFHKIHQSITFTYLKQMHESRALAAAITKDGVLKATRDHVGRVANEVKDPRVK